MVRASRSFAAQVVGKYATPATLVQFPARNPQTKTLHHEIRPSLALRATIACLPSRSTLAYVRPSASAHNTGSTLLLRTRKQSPGNRQMPARRVDYSRVWEDLENAAF